MKKKRKYKWKKIPPVHYLEDCFDYNPDTGHLCWRARPVEHFKSLLAQRRWNAKYRGEPVGHMHEDAHIVVDIDGQTYQAKRILWKLVHREEPGGLIVAKDGNNANLKASNLECVSPVEKRRRAKILKAEFQGC